MFCFALLEKKKLQHSLLGLLIKTDDNSITAVAAKKKKIITLK